ncbi:2OG-Fe(II) oxygenase superfamily protein [Balamuthia mandrillaris]
MVEKRPWTPSPPSPTSSNYFQSHPYAWAAPPTRSRLFQASWSKDAPSPSRSPTRMAAFLWEEGYPSPHGQGFDTVIDPRARSSKEFAPQDFSFAHPSWNERISSLAQQVAIQLGAASTRTETETTLEARPYKLLFYGEGDHFLPHRDTEKESGISNSSTGGALLVHHNSKDTCFDFGASTGMAGFQCHYAAHYADVEHKVQPVTSGHRLAVVYNIVWTSYTPTFF